MEYLGLLVRAHPFKDTAEILPNLLPHIHYQGEIIVFPEEVGPLIKYGGGKADAVKGKRILQGPAGKPASLGYVRNLALFHDYALIIHHKLGAAVNYIAQHVIGYGTFRINPGPSKGIFVNVKKVKTDCIHK